MGAMIVVASARIALIVMNGRRWWSRVVVSACLMQTGAWEGDTVMGKGGKRALLTRVERKTLYTVIMRLPGQPSALLAKAAVEGMEGAASKKPDAHPG